MANEPDLRQGATDADTGGYVTYLQQLLGDYYTGTVDGIFGPITDEAVRRYQQDNGLTVDGWVGPITWGVLTGESGGQAGGEGTIQLDLNDFPALYRVYEAYMQSGGDENTAADMHLAMIGVNTEGLDTDDDDTAYA